MVEHIGVVFGGVSVEHEVSVITGVQAAHALDRSRYRPVPVYISKAGDWYTGDMLLRIEEYRDIDALLRKATPVSLIKPQYGVPVLVEQHAPLWRKARRYALDVLLLALHGGEGEDGSFQGLCETWNLPYTSSGVRASALAMDKVVSKWICRQQGIPVVDFVAFREAEWVHREDAWLGRIEEELGYPVVVKPAHLGSSIGISLVATREELERAIEEAFRFDEKVLVEKAVQPLREINCSVLGTHDDAQASVLEEPVRGAEHPVLTFEDKYQRRQKGGGSKTEAAGMASLDRLIPAPLDEEKTREVQELALRIFRTFECSGVVRIDFLLHGETGELFFNELNTIPGSLSFYLWEPSGISFEALTHRLIEIAKERHRQKHQRVRIYEPNLLAGLNWAGVKK